jgi:23S rRNA pseudouridine1911/1915/1917 synthase
VPAAAHGHSLLDWLAATYRHSTREEWATHVREGRVTLDDRGTDEHAVLSAGQELCWSRPAWDEPDVPLDFAVVYEDAHVLVVDKPSGLPTLPGGGFHDNTLLARVHARDPKWAPMHRLGRGTSGLVAFATPDAAPALQRAFRARDVVKRYVGRVSAALAPQTLTAPIGLVPHARMGQIYAVTEHGRFAQTIVERVDGPLAFVRIVTGRPHQIRIHLAHAGAPLAGDPLYGAHGVLLDARPGDCGYDLRATQLAFDHPVTGRRLELNAAAG